MNFFVFSVWAIFSLVMVGTFFHSYFISVLYALLIILVFSFYLVFDIQRLVSNKGMGYLYEVI